MIFGKKNRENFTQELHEVKESNNQNMTKENISKFKGKISTLIFELNKNKRTYLGVKEMYKKTVPSGTVYQLEIYNNCTEDYVDKIILVLDEAINNFKIIYSELELQGNLNLIQENIFPIAINLQGSDNILDSLQKQVDTINAYNSLDTTLNGLDKLIEKYK